MRLFHTAARAAVPLTVLFLLACSAGDDLTPDERRAQELNRAIMCPVCPGESIDQSQNQLAAQMRAIVAEKLAAGESEAEIKSFFVERYGDSVLLSPPERGFNLLVWFVPVVGLAAAVLAAALALRRMRRAPHADEKVPVPELSRDEREEYVRRIESALDIESGQGAERQ